MKLSFRVRLIVALCVVAVVAPGAVMVAHAQCDAATLNAQMSVLVLGYVGQQATATDDAAALDLASKLQSDIAALLAPCGGAAPPPTEVAGTDGGAVVEEPATGGNALINNVNTPGTPINPTTNYTAECDNRTATTNGVRVTAFLPAGDYKVTLLPERFQTFDTILFVSTSAESICSSESGAAREYVVDFSQANIGRQVYGHNSGGVLEFNVPGSANELSPVEIIFGGQDRADVGTTGQFMLIIEGARLTPGANEHFYNVSITESMFAADTALSAIMLGVTDVLDPSLSSGTFAPDGTFIEAFVCEDAGTLDCDTEARLSLEGTSVVEAAVRTTRGDELDAAIEVLPGAYLAAGLQEVTFRATELQDDTLSREEYVMVFYGGIN